MLASVMTALSDLAGAAIGAIAGLVGLWPVAVMVGMFIVGVGISFITGLIGKKGKKKRR